MKNIFNKYSKSQLTIFAVEYLFGNKVPGVFTIETDNLYRRLSKRGVPYAECQNRVEQCFLAILNDQHIV